MSSDYASPFPIIAAVLSSVVLTAGDDVSMDYERELAAIYERD
ncbi:hypothetical protein [Nocardia wallacei]|nr:hypothetical protein [Nocardia wallacei]